MQYIQFNPLGTMRLLASSATIKADTHGTTFQFLIIEFLNRRLGLFYGIVLYGSESARTATLAIAGDFRLDQSTVCFTKHFT